MLLAPLVVALLAACAPAPIYRPRQSAAPTAAPDTQRVGRVPVPSADTAGARVADTLNAVPADSATPSPVDTTAPRFVLSAPLADFDCRRITSRFASRRSGSAGGHEGIDIDAETGDDVLAAAAGTVSFSGHRRGYGNLVVIEHEDGFSTCYGHLVYATVRQGESVGAGSRIGRAGSRGRATGAHLHFELRRGGRAIDPAPHLCLDSTPR